MAELIRHHETPLTDNQNGNKKNRNTQNNRNNKNNKVREIRETKKGNPDSHPNFLFFDEALRFFPLWFPLRVP